MVSSRFMNKILNQSMFDLRMDKDDEYMYFIRDNVTRRFQVTLEDTIQRQIK